jgi:Pyridoxamine 5'-phosphate oxidase
MKAISAPVPIAEQLSLPSSYGSPHRLLDWTSVEQRLVDSMHYWLATVRRDGTAHVVPVDGMWLDDGCYFGGDPATVHIQNLSRDGRATLHLEDGESAVIVEGVAEWVTPSKTDAQRLAAAAKAKYGYAQSAASYQEGVWRLQPIKVLAWNTLYVDATRFRFSVAD